jgi:hypothetical protein
LSAQLTTAPTGKPNAIRNLFPESKKKREKRMSKDSMDDVCQFHSSFKVEDEMLQLCRENYKPCIPPLPPAPPEAAAAIFCKK